MLHTCLNSQDSPFIRSFRGILPELLGAAAAGAGSGSPPKGLALEVLCDTPLTLVVPEQDHLLGRVAEEAKAYGLLASWRR